MFDLVHETGGVEVQPVPPSQPVQCLEQWGHMIRFSGSIDHMTCEVDSSLEFGHGCTAYTAPYHRVVVQFAQDQRLYQQLGGLQSREVAYVRQTGTGHHTSAGQCDLRGHQVSCYYSGGLPKSLTTVSSCQVWPPISSDSVSRTCDSMGVVPHNSP